MKLRVFPACSLSKVKSVHLGPCLYICRGQRFKQGLRISPPNREQSARRFSGMGSFLRRVQLQVGSLPWPGRYGGSGRTGQRSADPAHN